MGADFLCCFIPAVCETLERKQALALHMKNLSDEELAVVEDCGRFGDVVNGDDLVDRAGKYWDLDGRRDLDIIGLPGSLPHYASGGMSYGDNPTDSFDVITSLISIPGVYGLLEKWCKEDEHEREKERTLNCQDLKQAAATPQ